MRKTVVLLLCATLSLFAKRAPRIESITVADQATWKECNAVYILPFTIEETEKLSSSEEFYARFFAQELRFKLAKSKLFEKVVVLSDTSTIPTDGIILHGVLNKLDGGNNELRTAIGFGAGSSWCKASVELINPLTDSVIIVAKHKARSGSGTPNDIMMKSTKEAAVELAEALIFYKKQK